MKVLSWVAAAAVVVAAGSAGAFAFAGAESGGRYRVATASVGDVSQTVATSGTVDRVNRTDLSFGSDGTVASVSVAQGDQVSAGQELAALDDAELLAAEDEAAAALASAKATLSAAADADAVPSASVAEAHAAVSAAVRTAQEALAARAAACAEPGDPCTAALAAAMSAQDAVSAAQDTLQESLDSPPQERGSVADAQAAVDKAEADLVAAQQALAGTTLVAPVAGTVASVSTAVGGAVTAGQAVVVVIGKGAAVVAATVPVERVAALAVGQPATVTPSGTSATVPGTVTRIGAIPDPEAESVAYPVTITVAEPPPTMAAGSSATATIVVATATDVLTVPTSAVDNGTVSVLSGDQSTPVPVTVGAMGPTRTEIKSGLRVGDQVVLADLDEPLPTGDSQQQGPVRMRGPGGDMPGGGMRVAPPK